MTCEHIFACGTCNDRIVHRDERHAEAIAAVRKRAEKAETEREEWKAAALAWREMNACLRIGKLPSESLYTRCDKARLLVERSGAS